MRRTLLIIIAVVSIALLSSCGFATYNLTCVPSWLMGEWEAESHEFDRLYISESDIEGWIGGRDISVRDDLRYGCRIDEEYMRSDMYYLELYYGYGRTKSFQFIKGDTDDTFTVRYQEESYSTITVTETFNLITR